MKLKRFFRLLLAAALLIAAAAVLVGTFSASGNIGETVAAAGRNIGENVGWFKGSVEGIGYYDEKYDEGREKGLEAEDTVVSDVTGVELGTEKLQVLAANVSLIVDNEVSDKYAALALMRGNLVFTVDLGKAVVYEDRITLSDVEYRFSIDHTQSELLDEYQKLYFGFGNGVEAGYAEYLNTTGKIEDRVSEYVEDYDVYLQEARASAIEQVSMIAGNVSGKTRAVEFEKGA